MMIASGSRRVDVDGSGSVLGLMKIFCAVKSNKLGGSSEGFVQSGGNAHPSLHFAISLIQLLPIASWYRMMDYSCGKFCGAYYLFVRG